MPNLYRAEKNSIPTENRDEKKASSPKKSFNFKTYKNNTIKSLNQVEYFLHDFHHFIKYVKLYKILK